MREFLLRGALGQDYGSVYAYDAHDAEDRIEREGYKVIDFADPDTLIVEYVRNDNE